MRLPSLWQTVLVYVLLAIAFVSIFASYGGVSVSLIAQLLLFSIAAAVGLYVSRWLFRKRVSHWDLWATICMGGTTALAGLIGAGLMAGFAIGLGIGGFWLCIMQAWKRKPPSNLRDRASPSE